MARRGRKSAAELSVIRGAGPLFPGGPHEKPDPPAELSDDEAKVWRNTVEAMRPGWFTAETLPLLQRYCVHVVLAQRIARAIDPADLENDIGRFDKLTSMHVRQTKAMLSCATKLRLTHQSTTNYKARKHDPTARLRKPWEMIETSDESWPTG